MLRSYTAQRVYQTMYIVLHKKGDAILMVISTEAKTRQCIRTSYRLQ